MIKIKGDETYVDPIFRKDLPKFKGGLTPIICVLVSSFYQNTRGDGGVVKSK
jgi:hypothetical protein